MARVFDLDEICDMSNNSEKALDSNEHIFDIFVFLFQIMIEEDRSIFLSIDQVRVIDMDEGTVNDFVMIIYVFDGQLM